jgi:hypothetical protein
MKSGPKVNFRQINSVNLDDCDSSFHSKPNSQKAALHFIEQKDDSIE